MYLDVCFLMMMFLFMFMLIFFSMGLFFLINNLMIFIEFNMFNLNSSSIVMTIYLDWMSLMFLSVVLLISSSVIFYSKNYMLGDLMMNRFISLVMMFVFSMFLLIISPNLISILLGWDGLGLVSYCLVIYYQNIKSFSAGMLTVLSNRLGDIFLLMSIVWMLNFGGWNYIYYVEFMKLNKDMMIILFFVLLASFTKSAQIPFSSWLPAAMAAPTPVSSLVHSSTLVTAGVYLLIRFEKLFNNEMIFWFLLFSLLTMFMSGLNANFEYDLKKIIALSTLSQLGLMMSILFLGMGNLAFFHLLTHALFKALLFMCAGLMIHNLMSFQDIRNMGSISMQMPLVSMCFNISNLALCGFPFLAGFYSKDLILDNIFSMNFNFFLFFMFFMSTMFTVIYTFRLIFFSMIMNYNMISVNFMSDKLWDFNKSLLILLFMVICGGSILSWMIFPYPQMFCLLKYFKLLPLFFIIMGIYMGYKIYKMNLILFSCKYYFIKSFLSLMWFLPIISINGLIKIPLLISMSLSIFMDQGWTENILGQSVNKIIFIYSSLLDLLIYYFNLMLSLFMLLLMFCWYYFIFL